MNWKEIIKKSVKFVLFFFYIAVVIGLIAGPIAPGVMTLLPSEASKPNYMGYYSTCSFAPFSTMILLVLVVIGVVLLIKTRPVHHLINIFKSE